LGRKLGALPALARQSGHRAGLRLFSGENVEAEVERFTTGDLYASDRPGAEHLLSMVNSWLLLTTVLNELARSMGQPDFYPFVMSRTVLRKLHFIHSVIGDEQPYAAER
jgi:hypothetical protein